MSAAGRLPLAGIRVIDFTWVGAGPFTTKIMADFGAEVVKIESAIRPDQLRRAEPLVGGRGLDESGYFAVRNTNKKSVTINMKTPAARELVLAMAREADVVANSFSPGAMAKFGLSYGDLAAANPAIIYLSMPMAGDSGPYRNCIGYGMSIAALVGSYGLSARAGEVPVGTGTNFPDHLPNPLHAVFALLAALEHRKRTGEGQEIVVSQIESTFAAFPDAVLDYAANGRIQRPGRAADAAPQGIYRCAGPDRWCAVSVRDDAAFARLCAVIGRPDLACDPGLTTLDQRCGRAEELDDLLGSWIAVRTAEAAVGALQQAGLAAEIVATPKDMLEGDRQLAARGFWQRLDHPVMGGCVYHGIAGHFSATPTAYRSPAPLLGQHNSELAALTGVSEAEIAALTAANVIR